jgi:integrase
MGGLQSRVSNRQVQPNFTPPRTPIWTDTAGQPITAHGFRSTFRDWAGETTAHPREVIEHALAHQLKDKAEAAYARGSLFDKRIRLMADWAAYCAKVQQEQTGNVVEIRGAA